MTERPYIDNIDCIVMLFTDIPQCGDTGVVCPENETCVNNATGFECHCNTNFTRNNVTDNCEGNLLTFYLFHLVYC